MGKRACQILLMSLALLAAGPMSAQDTDEESPNTVVYRVGDNNLFANVGYGYISSKITGEGTGPLHHGVDVRIGYDRALGRGNGIGVLASMFLHPAFRGADIQTVFRSIILARNMC